MRSLRTAGFLVGLALTGGLVPHLGRAEEDAARRGLKVEPPREVLLPFHDLTFDPKMRVTEGPRMLGDLFPYLAAAPRHMVRTRAVEVVPETLPSLLHAAPRTEGSSPTRIRTGRAAIEAVRLFLAGPLVTDAAAAERLIETGEHLAATLEHHEVKVTAHRPEGWPPRARPVPADGDPGSIEAWDVSLVAFEMDRMLRLVHVKAKVLVNGTVVIERTPIVNGPMTSWQTAAIGEYTDEMQRREDEMRAEAVAARRAYAKVLRPARDLDTFWAAGRVLHDMNDVRALFGKPDRDVGSGIHIWTYDLTDGTSVVFGAGPDGVVYVRHVRGAVRPLKGFETLGNIYAGPAR